MLSTKCCAPWVAGPDTSPGPKRWDHKACWGPSTVRESALMPSSKALGGGSLEGGSHLKRLEMKGHEGNLDATVDVDRYK